MEHHGAARQTSRKEAHMRIPRRLFVLVATAIGLAVVWNPAEAQLGGIKDKLKKKGEQKATETVDKAASDALAPGDTTESAEKETAQPAAAKGGTATAEDMTLYTKYDFVPGDKVIFFDDLSGEEIGEFPSRWKLDSGVFEVAKQGSENYIMCTDEGFIRPKAASGPLPPKYTVEMEFYAKGPEFKGHWFMIEWMNADDEAIGVLALQDNQSTFLTIAGDRISDKALPNPVGPGKHTMRIMATKSTIKCYIDSERVANVPAVEGFAPVGFRVHLDPWTDEPNNPMLMRSFRYA
jgi:hypothetical protein